MVPVKMMSREVHQQENGCVPVNIYYTVFWGVFWYQESHVLSPHMAVWTDRTLRCLSLFLKGYNAVRPWLTTSLNHNHSPKDPASKTITQGSGFQHEFLADTTWSLTLHVTFII